jgi:hypothetical protein
LTNQNGVLDRVVLTPEGEVWNRGEIFEILNSLQRDSFLQKWSKIQCNGSLWSIQGASYSAAQLVATIKENILTQSGSSCHATVRNGWHTVFLYRKWWEIMCWHAGSVWGSNDWHVGEENFANMLVRSGTKDGILYFAKVPESTTTQTLTWEPGNETNTYSTITGEQVVGLPREKTWSTIKNISFNDYIRTPPLHLRKEFLMTIGHQFHLWFNPSSYRGTSRQNMALKNLLAERNSGFRQAWENAFQEQFSWDNLASN